MKIPKKIFQTHKSLEFVKNHNKLNECMESWKNNPGYEYYFYDDNDIQKFFEEEMDTVTLSAFNKLPINVMKADLWRYCVIYKYGGIYADVDTRCNINLSELRKDKELVITRDNDVDFCQWFFSAPKYSKVLRDIINLVVHRILNDEFTGLHFVHYFTGPSVFTDAIILYIKKNDRICYADDNLLKNYCKNKGRTINTNIIKYDNNQLKDIYILDFEIHKKIVHLFMGINGWKKERENYNVR